jgi:hypothetical protein
MVPRRAAGGRDKLDNPSIDRAPGADIVAAPSAGVAEWQTRQTQNLLSERTWEFKSPRPHQSITDVRSKKRRLPGFNF